MEKEVIYKALCILLFSLFVNWKGALSLSLYIYIWLIEL